MHLRRPLFTWLHLFYFLFDKRWFSYQIIPSVNVAFRHRHFFLFPICVLKGRNSLWRVPHEKRDRLLSSRQNKRYYYYLLFCFFNFFECKCKSGHPPGLNHFVVGMWCTSGQLEVRWWHRAVAIGRAESYSSAKWSEWKGRWWWQIDSIEIRSLCVDKRRKHKSRKKERKEFYISIHAAVGVNIRKWGLVIRKRQDDNTQKEWRENPLVTEAIACVDATDCL